jgi:hypothetical protein
VKKTFGPLDNEWPKTNDEAVTVPNIFVVAIFGTLERSQGYFCWQCKKVINQPILHSGLIDTAVGVIAMPLITLCNQLCRTSVQWSKTLLEVVW